MSELFHYGVKGQKWGRRRYQMPDGRWTVQGKSHYKLLYGPGTEAYKAKMAARKAGVSVTTKKRVYSDGNNASISKSTDNRKKKLTAKAAPVTSKKTSSTSSKAAKKERVKQVQSIKVKDINRANYASTRNWMIAKGLLVTN